MIKYTANQVHVESNIIREATYLSVFDKEGNKYNIRVNKQGGLEISSVGNDLEVVCKTSNTLTVGIDE